MAMTREMEKFVDILRVAHKECKGGNCHECEVYGNGSDCVYMLLAKRLIEAGAVIPFLCGECGYYSPNTCTCKIKRDSWGAQLERGPHDFCSDGCPRNDK